MELNPHDTDRVLPDLYHSDHNPDMVLENKEAQNRYYENQDRYREEDPEKGSYRSEESVEVVEVSNFREKEKFMAEKPYLFLLSKVGNLHDFNTFLRPVTSLHSVLVTKYSHYRSDIMTSSSSSSSSSEKDHNPDMVLENKEADNRYYENQDRYREDMDPEKGSYRSQESVEVVEVSNFREKEKVKREKSIYSWSFGRSDISKHLAKACIAEGLGCFFLILICVGSANSRILVQLTTGVTHLQALYWIGISISFGIGCAGIIHILSETSGGHINPAVTLALFVDRRISFIHCLFYIIAQFLGGFLGAGILYGVGNHGNLTTDIYGGNSFNPDEINFLQAFFIELFGTMFLVLVVFSTIDVRRGHDPSFLQPLAIGFAILVLHIWMVPNFASKGRTTLLHFDGGYSYMMHKLLPVARYFRYLSPSAPLGEDIPSCTTVWRCSGGTPLQLGLQMNRGTMTDSMTVTDRGGVAGILYGVGNHGNLTTDIYGGNSFNPDEINFLQAFFIELFGTMFLVLVVFSTIDVRRGHDPSFLQPLAIGFAILVLHIWMIPYTNCAINPVRGSVWNIVIGNADEQIFIFLLAPLCGGALAVPLYNLVFK
eukprot:sb/3463219/